MTGSLNVISIWVRLLSTAPLAGRTVCVGGTASARVLRAASSPSLSTVLPEQLGKATNKDAGKGKNTYPGLIGMEASQEEARRQLEAALSALREFGAEADGLRALARFVVERKT